MSTEIKKRNISKGIDNNFILLLGIGLKKSH